MRRALALVSASLLLLVLALPAAADEPSPTGWEVLLAVENDLGPDPQPRDAEGNPARELAGYEDQDVPFTWGAAWILTFAGLVGLALLVGLYYFAVYRPSRESDSQ